MYFYYTLSHVEYIALVTEKTLYLFFSKALKIEISGSLDIVEMNVVLGDKHKTLWIRSGLLFKCDLFGTKLG